MYTVGTLRLKTKLWRLGLPFLAAVLIMAGYVLRREANELRWLAGENGGTPTPLYTLDEGERVRFEGKLRSESSILAPGSGRACAAYMLTVSLVQRGTGESKAPDTTEVHRESEVADRLVIVGADGHLVVPQDAWTRFTHDWSRQVEWRPSYVPRKSWEQKPPRLLYYEEREQCLQTGDDLWATGLVGKVIRRSTGEAAQASVEDSVAVLELSPSPYHNPALFPGTQEEVVGHLVGAARSKNMAAAALAAIAFVLLAIWFRRERRHRQNTARS